MIVQKSDVMDRWADKRKHPRRNFVADVEIAPESSPPPRFRGACGDISLGGMFVATTADVPADMPFTATITPPGGQALKVYARVVHVRRGEGFGCIFRRLPQTAEIRLHHWLGRNAGLAPVSGTIDV